MRSSFALLLIVAAGCTLPDLPTQPQYAISNDEPTTATRAFEGCVLRYVFRTQARSLDINSLEAQLKLACFDAWSTANGYLDFVRAVPGEPAELNIVFSETLPQSPQPQPYTSFGLFAQKIDVLSRLVRQADNTCTIHLLNTHAWTELELRRVLLHQIGAALGMAPSTRPESIMWAQLNSLTRLDTSDVNAIRQLYNQPCDQWTRLKDLPFDASAVETFAATSRRGYVVLDGTPNRNALWEFLPDTQTWYTRTPCPISQVDNNGFTPVRLAFATDSALFVGNILQRTWTPRWTPGQKGVWMRYRPAGANPVDGWTRIDSLPQLGFVDGRSFSVGGKAYVATIEGDYRIGVSEYDPLTNRWTRPLAFERLSAGYYAFHDTYTFVLNQQAFIITSTAYTGRSWRFDPARIPYWTAIAPFGDYVLTQLGFAVRGAGYLVNGSTTEKHVWQYRPTQGWKQMANCPAKGKLVFSFVVGNRVYVSTNGNQDEFWMYRP